MRTAILPKRLLNDKFGCFLQQFRENLLPFDNEEQAKPSASPKRQFIHAFENCLEQQQARL